MKIGMVCFPTYGGSSAVATELGLALGRLGHQVHFIGYDLPFRLDLREPGIFFHQVEIVPYPVFRFPPYTLALASHLAQIVVAHDLQLVHLHYAIPHAAAAFLAKQLIPQTPFKTIITLHGTDIQLASLDPAYRGITNFSLNQADAVTAVSGYLQEVTEREFQLRSPVKLIYNFIEPRKYARLDNALKNGAAEKIVIHISNFRALKRVDRVVKIFAQISKQVPAKLWLVGEGPERKNAEKLAAELGIGEAVEFLGERSEITTLLSLADLFLLPSDSESFGLAALEAMACGVPVIASNVGGLPEVIANGEGGYIFAPADINAMGEMALKLLREPELYQTVAAAGQSKARRKFSQAEKVAEYEALYRKVIS